MRDIKGIYNFVEREEFKDKTFILQIPFDEMYDYEFNERMDWEEVSMLAQKVNLICAIENFKVHAPICQGRGLKFYWNYPITSFYELDGAINNGVCYVKLGAPLYFSLTDVSRHNVPIRLVANVCHDNLFPREDGIAGTYIRPEDVKLYEQYVTTIEFVTKELRAEAALLDTYKSGVWPGNLKILLTNFDYDIDNRAVPEEFGSVRLNCQQRCKRTGSCHFCESAIKFADVINKHRNDEDLLARIKAAKEKT